MLVRYLVYISRLADPRGPAAVPAVIRGARTNNAIRGITGALIFDGGRFCQYIEGDPDEIERTYASIACDPRHDEIRVLASGYAPVQRFSRWSMAYVYAVTPELIELIGRGPLPSVADAFESALEHCDMEV